MSDDDNDLGGLGPATPFISKKPTRTTKSTKAGPSTSKPPPKGRPHSSKAPPSNPSDVEEIPPPSGPFDFPPSAHNDDSPPTLKTHAKRGGGESALVVNGKMGAKGKGKSKAPPQSKSTSRKHAAEAMDVDAIEILDEMGEEEQHRRTHGTTKTASRLKQSTARRGEADEIARLTEKIKQQQAHIDALSSQLEEVFNIRETEAEKLYKQQQAQFEVQLKAHEDVIRELNNQIAMKEPLMRSGNSTVLNLLTREAADEEKRAVEQEVARWKNIAEQRGREIKQRDERIASLERSEKDLQSELKLEIDRSQALAAKAHRTAPPSVTRGGSRPAGVPDDPKHVEIVRLYEDVTNLLVTAMKVSTGTHLGLEDWTFTCIYTYVEEDASDRDSATTKSLNFLLRTCYEVVEGHSGAVTSKEQLIPSVQYVPQNLDFEPPEFVKKLDFLGEPFSFGRNQLPLFLRTMYERMKSAVRNDDESEEEEDDESVQEIVRS
ncbi:hypothetical protein H0H92_014839 [Tricholoma furcatifolium]|nr:hypothetical protein H0H92_014839 [Tricholoma furcatifolium]